MDEKKQGGMGAPSGYSAGSEGIAGSPGRGLSEDEKRRFETGYSAMPEEIPPGAAISEPNDTGSEPHAASAPRGDGATTKRAVDRVMETAQHGADKAREVAKQRAEQGKEKVADRIEEMSSKVEEEIVDKAEEYVSTVTGLATHYMERTAELLRGKSTDELLEMARDEVRDKPLVVAAGAFALGFIGARFLKS